MNAVKEVVTLALEDEVAVLTVDYAPVNALSQAVRAGILEKVRQACAQPSVRAIVLHCAGRTFLAGADITEFGKPPQAPSLYEAQDAIESARVPVIAAIHGTALGGGLETALCCHYRVAVPSAKCGLPEVKLGLLPGAGGTQRLPRIVGVQRALEMIGYGQHVPAHECHAMGLIDELIPEGQLREGAIAFARRIVAEGRPLKRVRDLNDKMIAARAHPEIFAEFRKANARRFRGFEAPEANIRCIEAAVNQPIEDGLKLERKLIGELMVGTQSIAQRYVFFAERKVWRIPDIADDTPTVAVRQVGIIGAGTMGGGIAMNFANVGIEVILVETRAEALERGLATIRRNYETSARRTGMDAAEVERRMARITGSLSLEAVANVDLVIEAVFENMALKKEIFAKLDRIVRQGAVLATNTSALDVNEIASATRRPQDVVGMHFFSPANVMRLLEVVRGAKSSPTVVATAMQVGKKIGKIGALSGVCPGFIGNRILRARQEQAGAMILEGAMPWDVDRQLYDFGFPMGPFAMSDLAGLDIGWSRETTSSSTVREVLCEQDRRGQKTGGGYYDYDEKRNASPSPVTEKIIRDFMARKGVTPRVIGAQEILERCVYPMINEAAKILDEGIAIRASDIDIVWVNGYGWPVYRGGPMFYADTLGLPHVVERLEALRSQLGGAFVLSPLLARLAAEGSSFAAYDKARGV